MCSCYPAFSCATSPVGVASQGLTYALGSQSLAPVYAPPCKAGFFRAGASEPRAGSTHFQYATHSLRILLLSVHLLYFVCSPNDVLIPSSWASWISTQTLWQMILQR